MLLLIMYTCICHDVDVRNSIGITFSHCMGCLIVMHTIPHIRWVRAPFTNALLLIDNGLTNNKQNTFEPLLFIICQRPVVGGQTLQ